ncbi:MAG: ribosome maturation factor [Chitinophagales bacterium]|nr:ribosome maturation factor [Chitinophagales bacterium]
MEAVCLHIEKWLEPVLSEQNIFLVDIKYLKGGKKIEVYVDTDSGIDIEQCATISRFLEKKLEESGMVPSDYVLEVSSPGMDNPLKVPRQYFKRIGRTLQVWTNDGLYIEGKLLKANDSGITIEKPQRTQKGRKKTSENIEEQQPTEILQLPYQQIKKAFVQFKW